MKDARAAAMSRAGRLPVKDDVDLFESIGISSDVKGVTFNLRVAEVLCARLFGTHTSLYTRCGRLPGPCQYAIWHETGPAPSRTFEEKDGSEFTCDVYQMLTHTHLSSSLGLSAFGLVCSPRQPTPSRFPDLVDPFRTAPHAAVTMPSKELPEGASRRPPAAASAEFPRVSMRAQVRSASSR